MAVEGSDGGADLERRLARSRRMNWLVAGVATLVLAGTVIVSAFDGGEGSEGPAGATGRSAQADPSSAEAIVAALPDEPVDPHEVQLIASVSRYDTCDALVDQLHRVGAAHVGSRGFGGGHFGIGMPWTTGFAEDAALMRASGTEQSFSADAGAPGETLGTNVIVAGVDEPDSVKAGGSLVVELQGPQLRIIDTTTSQIVGRLALAERSDDGDRFAYPSTLLLEGTRVVVFGHESVAAEPIPGDRSASRPPFEYMTVTFVDIANPAAPAITDRTRIEGRLVAVRRVGDQVRMVTTSSLADLPIVYPSTPSAVAPALEQNRLAVAGSAVDDWIPAWDHGEGTEAQRLMECTEVVVPDTFAGVQMTSLVQFDLAGPFQPQATGLLAPAEQLTATATDVVIASHVWVDPIDRSDDFDDWSTALHRFTFGEPESADTGPRYLASGAVDGSLRDDFSLSVLDDGTVGAVTADVLPWQSREEADVTVRLLGTDESTATLSEVGSLVPEASGIAVAGVRFLGDRLLVSSGFGGKVVSAVDLSERTAPRDLGTVTLTGSGGYLHPLEGNRVLAIGSWVRGEGEGLRGGSHVTLLDLNAAPRVVAEWSLEDASTSVEYDHHGFTWWPSRSVAGFGIQHHARDRRMPPPDALLLTVQDDALIPQLVTPQEADLGPKCTPSQLDRRGCDDTGPPQVNRVLVVDGVPWLYTSESLERLDPESFASVGVVPLPPVWG